MPPSVFKSSAIAPFFPSAATRISSSERRSGAAIICCMKSRSSSATSVIAGVPSASRGNTRAARLFHRSRKALSAGRNSPIDQRLKSIRIANGNVGENLAVNFHTCRRQRIDQPAIGEAMLARRSVDALDPECSKVPLAQFAADIGVLQRTIDGGIRRGDVVLAAAVKTFGLFQDALAPQA